MGFAFFSPGQYLFKKGDSGEYFYIVLHGQVDLYLTNPQIKKLQGEIETLEHKIKLSNDEI